MHEEKGNAGEETGGGGGGTAGKTTENMGEAAVHYGRRRLFIHTFPRRVFFNRMYTFYSSRIKNCSKQVAMKICATAQQGHWCVSCLTMLTRGQPSELLCWPADV